jgi:acetylornithine deacetylase
VPAVKIGPGRSQLSHTADEHVEAAEIERAVAVYQAVARHYFGDGFRMTDDRTSF